MIRADLHFNHYYPFYTLKSVGRKKYHYVETINIHLSDMRWFCFTLDYDEGKLSSISFNHEKGKRFNLYDKGLKFICYVDFAARMKNFENFLLRGIKELKEHPSYRKVMVFGSNYKFNEIYELEFSYGNIDLKKGTFDHSIQDGKLVKPKREYDDTPLGKVGQVLDAIDDYKKFKVITEKEFNEDLNNVIRDYVDYLAPPKVIRKKEYQL